MAVRLWKFTNQGERTMLETKMEELLSWMYKVCNFCDVDFYGFVDPKASTIIFESKDFGDGVIECSNDGFESNTFKVYYENGYLQEYDYIESIMEELLANYGAGVWEEYKEYEDSMLAEPYE
jgi:uncharacterized protein YutD